MNRALFGVLLLLAGAAPAVAQDLQPVVPPERRGQVSAERLGTHDANRIRTRFFNYGMVGDYPPNPTGVDLSVFHSVEVPKGSGLNYTDGVTPFVLARIRKPDGTTAFVMETGFRERQQRSLRTGLEMRFEPRPGFAEPDPAVNVGRSVAISNDPRTWPGGTGGVTDPARCWVDKESDPSDPGWCGSWNGFFGKQPNADQESYFVMDDQLYDSGPLEGFFPDSRDPTRRGLGLRVEVRGFQWANPQSSDVLFWHYDIVNEGTTEYEDIIFGLYMDSGVGGSAISCDGVAESDDDNASFDTSLGLNLVYTFDERGDGVGLSSNCVPTGYLGYAYLETPGNALNAADDDRDGIRNERRDGGPGGRIEGQAAIRAFVTANYTLEDFERAYGALETLPAFKAGVWYTGDEDMDWVAQLHDAGGDGVMDTNDAGERDGQPTAGERNFDQTDIAESDQIGLTGFKMNRIGSLSGGPTDGIVFYDDGRSWPQRLFSQFTAERASDRFDVTAVRDYNIAFLFASGPFRLQAGRRERFSLALAYGGDLPELRTNVRVVQRIYDANYQFATPPPVPTVTAYAGDGYVRLAWDNAAENSIDPVTNLNDFEGYRIYRSTDPNFLDAQLVTNARGTGPFGNGRPLAQYDLANGITGFSNITVQGVAYDLGSDSGIRHTFTDTTVTNGRTYYYAVTSYDTGVEPLGFYPSENSLAVSRTPRGGIVLPPNVVEVRPNREVPGFRAGSVGEVARATVGEGTLDVQVVNPSLLRDGDEFRLDFQGFADSVRATSYTLTNVTTGQVVIRNGFDLFGSPDAPTGGGLLPIVNTLVRPRIDSVASAFSGTPTDLRFTYQYNNTLSANLRRVGYPEDFRIEFFDTFVDTSIAAIGAPSRPIKFRVTTASGQRLKVRFRDVATATRPFDNTLSNVGEYVELLTFRATTPTVRVPTWRLTVASVNTPPAAGTVFDADVDVPFQAGDRFTFTVAGNAVDADSARATFAEQEPYVVPNPYVAAAAFEPERFAVAGRGERRLEFRGIPSGATIRIYTVRGELVQTLTQDGSDSGIVPWDLRTRDLLEVAPGLYLFHVKADGVGEHTGKFAIIK